MMPSHYSTVHLCTISPGIVVEALAYLDYALFIYTFTVTMFLCCLNGSLPLQCQLASAKGQRREIH